MTGILEQVPAETYHNDALTDGPTLSASIAKLLISHSPLHAWTKHPKLNPDFKHERSKDEDKYIIGTAAHALLLEGREAVQLIYHDNYTTKIAQTERDEARARGQLPLLDKKWREVQAMCAAVRDQLAALEIEPALFDAGKPERTLVWEDSGVTCRARLDWLRDDGAAIDDLKTTSRSANPDGFDRTLFSMNYDFQAAFYLRGLKAITGADAEFRFVIAEVQPPYAVSLMGIDPLSLKFANEKVEWALAKWHECIATDSWPGYPRRMCYAQAPGWAENAWLEKEAREAA